MVSLVVVVVLLQQLLWRSGKDDDDGVVDEMDKDDDVLSIILTWLLFCVDVCIYAGRSSPVCLLWENREHQGERNEKDGMTYIHILSKVAIFTGHL